MTISTADALAGTYGPVSSRFMFERRTKTYQFLEDVSDGFDQSLGWNVDNDRPVLAVATGLTFYPSRATVDPNTDLIAITEQVLVNGVWTDFPVGLYCLSGAMKTREGNGVEQWAFGSISDVSMLLQKDVIPAPFTVKAASNYLATAKSILTSKGFTVSTLWPTTAEVLAVDMTWKEGTSWLAIINDLLGGVNYYPVWADQVGAFVTRARISPESEAPAVTWSTTAAPRMLIWPLGSQQDVQRFWNQVTVVIKDPARTVGSVIAQNNDPTSANSIANTGAIITQELNGDRALSLTTCAAIAQFTLREQAARSFVANAETLPDPRRWGHEFYQLTADAWEVNQLFRVQSWAIARTGNSFTMTHVLQRVSPVTITSPFSVAPAALVQAVGVAFNAVITAQNADGTTNTGYLGTVRLTSTDASATLPADYTFVGGDAGVKTLSVTFNAAGVWTVKALDALATAQGQSQPVTVT